jgi:SAM-dependent methyltransferase
MLETVAGNLYDYPKYYDLVFGSDWKAEFEFLRACFARYADRPVRRVFEPACGTGRLMYRLAEDGYHTAGNDLNRAAVRFCNARLERRGHPPAAEVGDMSDFQVEAPFDAAHCLINSFRHLPTEAAAQAHLQCVARALEPGGLYLLGLHLIPSAGEPIGEESWVARRGNLTVLSRLWSQGVDLRARQERVGMSFDVYTPTRTFRLEGESNFRTYTADQMESLLARIKTLELVATHDFSYDIQHPIRIVPSTEDVVYVLRKRGEA